MEKGRSIRARDTNRAGIVRSTRRSHERATFNLNSTVGNEEDEVHEVCPSRPIGRDEAKRKEKAETSSTSLATDFDVKSLAKLMVNEYACVNDLYNVKKGEEIKMELELKAAELEIRRKNQRQTRSAICVDYR
nr:hypothetical protein [Tanacetum cinerariifolium]GEV86943.1 hypothetical protein [Tanacetum cinerariifolium]